MTMDVQRTESPALVNASELRRPREIRTRQAPARDAERLDSSTATPTKPMHVISSEQDATSLPFTDRSGRQSYQTR